MAKPLLSIGMIVKNEIRSIERCLKALQPLRDAYPCELVIADTGSDDGTREVIRAYADICFDFPWVNDFSAARNAVIDRCSGQWLLTVDADEYLDEDLSGFQKLFSAPPKDQPYRCGITQRNYDNRDIKHAAYSDFVAVRLARLGVGIRYTGAIHELLELPAGLPTKIVLIPQIILHHDGYAYQTAEEKKKKDERNLALLDQCLEEEPDNINRMIQCIESSGAFPARRIQYITHGMEVLQRPDREPELLDGTLAARCASAALAEDLPQAEAWLNWCMEHYHDLVVVRIDAGYAAALWYYNKKKYEQVIPYCLGYLDAFEQERAGQTPPLERVVRVLQRASDRNKYKIITVLVGALTKQGQKEDALSRLTDWPLEKIPANVAKDWLRVLAPLEDVPGAAEEMARALPLLEPEGDDQWRKDRWRGILPLLRQFFKPGWGASEGAERPWRLLRECDGPLGQGARVMACGDKTEAADLLAHVEDWESFPLRALIHALTLGASLPTGLCTQRTDLRLKLLAAMAQGDPDFGFHMAVYPWQIPDTLSLLQTQFDLVTCAVQRIAPLKEADETELCRKLCGKLAELSKELLPRLYSPELLSNPADWIVLPGNHQFCLWLLEGEKARAAGDTAGYLRALRQGLKQAPRMKDLTEFLLDEAEREAARASATPELLALAEQVRGILSRFPPDDPAVKELKSSPVYQRVAFLLEDPASPILM